MIVKLIRQIIKPIKLIITNSAYRQWLKYFDDLKDKKHDVPQHIKVLNYDFKILNGAVFLNQFEEIFVDKIYHFVPQNKQPIIIDCGANCGLSVLYFKHYFPSSHIIAFEPDKELFDTLQRNVTHNSFKNITLNNQAVWNKNGFVNFNNSKLQDGYINELNGLLSVPCIKLETVLNQYELIDFLKIDIEGAELDVISDCKNLLYKVDHLFIEYHHKEQEPQNLSNLLEILTQCNFKFIITNNKINAPFINFTNDELYAFTLNIFAKNNRVAN
jgi:FkbM family methyltransferase